MSGRGEGFLAAKAAAVRACRVRQAPRGADLVALRERASRLPPPPPFGAALTAGETVALIAEFKRRSPAAGPLALRERPEEVAALYLQAGAAALSVLTDGEHFEGSLQDLEAVTARAAPAGGGRGGGSASGTGAVAYVPEPAPVLRKDFIVDEAAIYEARAAGAAAVLLIAAMLDDAELERGVEASRELGLESLVEVHRARELERALDAGAILIGINNRDLGRLETDLSITERLAPRVPGGVVVVSESGIRTAVDVARLRDAGAHAVLVGEALLRLAPAARGELARELAGVAR